jgi:hypothetical protein
MLLQVQAHEKSEEILDAAMVAFEHAAFPHFAHTSPFLGVS